MGLLDYSRLTYESYLEAPEVWSASGVTVPKWAEDLSGCGFKGVSAIDFYDDISFKRGDSNYGSFIYIKKPYSVLSVIPIKDNERIGWDKVVFGNENDVYVFFVKDKKITNPSRNTFTQKIYLGEETVKCYQMLLGKNPYIRFVKNDGSFVLAKIYGDFKDDSKMLDAMYDVVRLIPKINSLKNENGKAYLY